MATRCRKEKDEMNQMTPRTGGTGNLDEETKEATSVSALFVFHFKTARQVVPFNCGRLIVAFVVSDSVTSFFRNCIFCLVYLIMDNMINFNFAVVNEIFFDDEGRYCILHSVSMENNFTFLLTH